jgi:hypothetical protein
LLEQEAAAAAEAAPAGGGRSWSGREASAAGGGAALAASCGAGAKAAYLKRLGEVMGALDAQEGGDQWGARPFGQRVGSSGAGGAQQAPAGPLHAAGLRLPDAVVLPSPGA